MKTLAELRAEYSELHKATIALNESLENEQDEAKAEEVQTSIAANLDKLDTLKSEIESREKKENLSKRLQAHKGGMPKKVLGQSQQGNGSLKNDAKKPSGIQVREDESLAGYGDHVEMFTDIMNACRGESFSDKLEFLAADGDVSSTVSNPDGGFLIPETKRTQILEVEPEPEFIRQRTTPIQMNGPVEPIPYLVDKDHRDSVSGGFVVTTNPEGLGIKGSKAKYELLDLRARNLYGLTAPHENMLEDSPQVFASLIDRGFKKEFPSAKTGEYINGSGIGEWLGVLNSPAKIVVAKDSGPAQADYTFTYNNVIQMMARCYGFQNAIWLFPQQMIPQLALMNAGSTMTAPIWINNAREGIPSTLFGRPVFFTEHAKALGDEGDAILCDFSAYVTGFYKKMRGLSSIHARFDTHEREFKFWEREAGMPWWETTLQPKNGGDTLSPTVVLAARKP